MVQGVITFEGYQIDSINYEKDNQNENEDYSAVSPNFFIVKTENEEADGKFNIIMGVKIENNEEGVVLPFNAEVVIRGFFIFNKDEASEYNIEDLHIFKLINCSAILYPYLRSVLTDVTSKSRHAPLILPTMNFRKFISSRKLEEMLLDSSYYLGVN